MVKVIGVRFRRVGKIYYFDPLDMDIKQGDHVIVETARGVEYGYVVLGIREVAKDKVILPLKPVIRIATPKDDEQELDNKVKEKDAFKICLEKIKKHGLEMKLIDAEYTFDNNKVLFYFTADGRIDFNHVDFVYKKDSETDTLKDIDIHINAGETIGIIGGTGCGKSSFVNLISRLYDVKNGSVCVGGVDVRKYDIETLRDEVSVVLQKNVLFSGTILDNLRWGDENATEEECIEACRQACADEFIERMPDKYNTWIEQGGTNVSGGQRQRLCIARALLKKPKVLILDDSTSAVDTATDAKIKHAFATKIPGTTKLIVSQRISSIQDADRILVLDNGMVSGFDTHEHLVENNKVYREIYEVQTQGGGDFDEQAEEAKENQPVDANAKAADDKKGGADNE